MTSAPRTTRTSGSAQATTPPTVAWELIHAEPGALVYAVPRAKPVANPLLRRTPGPVAEWTPSGTPEHHHAAHHDGIEHPVLHYAGYVGRVGVLATALGVGAALAGTSGNAWAESGTGDTSSSEPSATPSSNRDSAPAPQTGQRNAGGRTTINRQRNAPVSVLHGAGDVRTSTSDRTDGEPANPAARLTDSPRLSAIAASADVAQLSGAEAQHDSSAPADVGSVTAPPTHEQQTTGPATRIPAQLPTPETPVAGTLAADPSAPAAGTVGTPASAAPAAATTAAPTPRVPAPAAPARTVTNRIASAILAPFSSPTTTPATQAAQTPVLFGLFSWLRRTFDTQAPAQSSDPTGNTLVDNARSPGTGATTPAAPSRTNGTVAGEVHVTDLSSDTLIYSVAGSPSRGTVTLNPTTGAFTYTPFETGRTGATADQLHDTFTVTVNDNHGTTATVPVSVDLDPAGAARVTTLAVSDPGTQDTVHVSVIVTDPETDPVTYLVVHDPAVGALTQTSGGFTYTATSAAAPAAAARSVAPAKSVATTKPVAAATATVTNDVILEGESLVLNPTASGSRYSDSTASGGRALLMSTNGTASTTVSLPASTKLVIRAKGDQYNGAPTMTVSLDGKAISTISVSSSSWTDYTVPVTAAAGSHTVSIAYTNDLRASASRDRNLRIDRVTVIAGAVTPPSTQTPAYFPTADWLWKPIASNPTVAPNSATWVSYLSDPGRKRVADMYEYGVTIVPASSITTSTPRYDVKFTESWGSDPFSTYRVAIPQGTRIPVGSDGHVVVIDPASGQVFGIWQAKYNKKSDTWSGSWGGMTPINGNGVDQSGSATAAGISRAAGVVTAAELTAAVAANTGVNHALVFSTDIAGPGFVGPAKKSDGTNIAAVATPIPEGYRIQLDPSINVDAIPNITPGEKVIAKTLQTYGAYVVDQGAARMAFIFETTPDATSTNPGAAYTNAGLAWDYYDMNHIPWSQLRVLAA